MVRICEMCNKEHASEYGSGRFCSKMCAKGFSTKAKRQDINKRVSEKLKGKFLDRLSPEGRIKSNEALKSSRLKAILTNHLDFDKNNGRKKLKRFLLKKNNRCSICGIDSWLNKPIVLELDHIDGNSNNSSENNIRLLCPNCHSQTPTFRGRNIKKQNISLEKIPESEFIKLINSGLNNRQILIKLDLKPAGGNYTRIERIRKKIITGGT